MKNRAILNKCVLTCVFTVFLLFVLSGNIFAEVNLNVDGTMTRSFTLDPGGKTRGEIVVQNQGDEESEVKVYLQDYLHYADGRNLFQKPGAVGRSNASWIALTPNQAVIPAKGSLTINFTLSVPPDPKLKGTYWSLLMIEPVPKSLLTPGKPENDVNIQVVTVVRLAVQMISTVGKSGEAKLRFQSRSLAREQGRRLLTLDLENMGDRLLTPHVWTELYNKKGQSSGKIDGSRHRIYPGCSARFVLDLSKLAPGGYKAVVVADNGDDNVFGANYTLELK
jgi:archaellum component FlaG (FlaF/FlaG flagellin family)